MSVEKKIAELVALGVDDLRTASIPLGVAQECARRWLVDAARDAERAKTRTIEREAMMSRLVENSSRYVDRGRAFYEWVQAIPGETLPYFTRSGAVSLKPLDLWAEGADHGAPTRARRLWEDGELSEASVLILAHAQQSRARNNAAREKAWKKTLVLVDTLIEERAAELDIEWTAALLTSTVALPDGTRVEWGEATRNQHASRLDMLARHAATELDSATRHRAAIDALDASGARCLNEMSRAAA